MSEKFFNFFSTHFLGMLFIMKYDVAFYPINIAFFSFIRIMLEANNISNLFEQFFRRFFHGMIARKILDIMIIWCDSQNFPLYNRLIYRKVRDIVLFRVNIPTNSLIYPIWGRNPESFRIIDS